MNSGFGILPEIYLQIWQFVNLKFPEHLIMNEWFWFYWKLRACTTIPINTATVNKAVKEIHNCILHLFMVLLQENLFPKFFYECINLFYMHWFQLKTHWKKNWRWLPTSSRKKRGTNKIKCCWSKTDNLPTFRFTLIFALSSE